MKELRYRLAMLSQANGALQRDYSQCLERISELEEAQSKKSDTEAKTTQVNTYKEELENVQTETEEKCSQLVRRASRQLADLAASCAAYANDDAVARVAIERARCRRLAEDELSAVVEYERVTRRGAEAELELCRNNLEDTAERLHAVEARANQAEERALAAERRCEAASRRVEQIQQDLNEKLRISAKQAETRLEVAIREAEARAATDLRSQKADEMERIARFQRTILDLEGTIAELNGKIDMLTHVPRGPHFGTYIRIKEENAELREKLLRCMQRNNKKLLFGSVEDDENASTVPHKPIVPRRRSSSFLVHSAIDIL